MMRSLMRDPQGRIKANLALEAFKAAVADPASLLWVDLAGEPDQTSQALLRDTFGFHPLAIADALDQIHVPKVDNWGAYLYLVVRCVAADGDSDQPLRTDEIDIFLGKNYIVTYHNRPIAALERIWDRCQKDGLFIKNGAHQLLYHLIDEAAADFLLLAEKIDEAINAIEDQLFGDPQPVLLEQIFSLKRNLLHLRRVVAPQREMVNKLARGDFEIIDGESRMYFRDVYDHFLRLYDILENLRDLAGSALEIYLSVVNNRMNSVMKILAIITTLFMPISFLVGFFGMNFFQPAADMPAWTGPAAFGLMLVAVILTPLGMYWWIRRRGWMQ